MQNSITLRSTTPADLHELFQFQLDSEGQQLAAFTPKDPADKQAYIEKFTRHLADPTITNKTILLDGVIVGSIAKFEIDGDAEITYWIDRNFWGKGIASEALLQLLAVEKVRPIFGRVAFDNHSSQNVLEKCGFVKDGTDRGFANARGVEIEEIIYKLS